MSRRTVAITGGTGFIGRALVERHLQEGDAVKILTRDKARHPPPPGCHVYQADLSVDGDDLVPFADGVDVLYHCAANLSDASQMDAVHVGGTRRLLAAAHGRIGHWVQLSSVGAYGRRREGVVTELEAERPEGSYESTKACADHAVMDEPDLSYAILRPSIVFGATMTNRSLRQMVSLVDRGLFLYVGAPGASANYVHLENVVEALHRCGRAPEAAGRTYILSDWRTIEDFVGAIASALGRRAPRRRIPELLARTVAGCCELVPRSPITRSRVDAITTRVVYSPARIISELGFEYINSVEGGIHELVGAYQAR